MKCFLLLTVFSLAAFGGDTRLIDAAKARDSRAVRTLLAQKAGPNEAAADGTTALHWAAHCDDLEMAGLLLRAGANVASPFGRGRRRLRTGRIYGSPAGPCQTLPPKVVM